MTPIESKRVALDRKIVLRFPDFDGFATEYAANLSMTGMFVRSREPQAAGTPVSFELRLEGGAPLVRGSGWVVWSRRRREGPDQPAGMGIEFTALDPKSRRLVRWMVLNQAPEGQGPYDVHAGTALAPATVRLVSRAAARRSRNAGLLTAVAIFAGLAGLVYWGDSSREPRVADRRGPVEGAASVDETTSVAPRQSSSEVVPRAPIPLRERAQNPNGEGSAAPASAGPSAARRKAQGAADRFERDSEAADAGIVDAHTAVVEAERAVRSWARAWSDQDVEGYLGYYAPDFVPDGDLSLGQWKKQRRQRLSAPRSIRVAVTRLEAKLTSDHEARVTFLQTYRSDGYADTVDKVLELAREAGSWKIRRELAD